MLPKKDTPLPAELLELPLFHRIKVEDTPEDKQQEHYENFGFFIKDGKYYTQGKAEKGKVIKLRISNFVMKFLYHFDNGTNNTIRLVYLYQKTEREGENPAVEESIIEVYSSELKKETFETTLKSKGCTYYGQVYTFQRILEYLMMHEKKAILMDQIGWSAEHKVFVFADAVYFEGQIHRIEELGVVDVGSVLFYLPAFSYANRKNDTYQKDRLYSYRAGKTDFLTWAGLFYQSYGKNGAIGTIYTIAAIFRDIIFNQAGFFPYLFSFGEAGTGKTSFAEIILSLFGKDILGKPINSTNVGLTREAAHTVNMMLYFKEYSSEASEAVQDFLLTTYDGSGRTTGIKSNDTRTKTYNPRSAILLDGNHMPTQRSATMSRMILLNFETARFNQEETLAHNQIRDLAKDGFGNVLKEVLDLREAIEAGFPSLYKSTARELKEWLRESSTGQVDERLLNHTALMLAVCDLAAKEIKLPFSFEVFKEIMIENLRNHNGLLKETSVKNIWWEAFAYNIKKGLFREFLADGSNKNEAHFRIVADGRNQEREILQIKLSHIYPAYVRYCKDNGMSALGLSSIKSILTNKSSETFIESNQKARAHAHVDSEFGSVYRFWIQREGERKTIDGVEIPISSRPELPF